MISHKLRAVVSAAALMLASWSVQAALIKISEPMPDDTGNIVWTVDISGINPASGFANGVFQAAGGTETFSFNYGTDANMAASNRLVYNIWEDSAFSVLSDIVIITTTQGSAIVGVSVNSTDGLTAIAGGFDLLETAGFMQIAQLARQDGTFDQIQFQSDPEPVPEPASLALLGIAGLALAASRRQRRTG